MVSQALTEPSSEMVKSVSPSGVRCRAVIRCVWPWFQTASLNNEPHAVLLRNFNDILSGGARQVSARLEGDKKGPEAPYSATVRVVLPQLHT